jgi:mRNA interferase MazF
VTFKARSRPEVYIPQRGDVIHTNFSPSAGTETALKHFAIVLTPKAYHLKTGRAIVCPITSKTKDFPFNLPIAAIPPHLPQGGAVLSDQVRTVDLHVRGSSFAGRLEDAKVIEIVDLLFTLLDEE